MRRLIPDADQGWRHDFAAPEDGEPRFVKAAPRKRGPPVGVHGRIRDDELRALHVLHVEGFSIRTLGHRVWRERYSTPQSAAMAISRGFRRLGLWTRPRQEATAKVQTDRRHPDSPGTADRKAYKRWLLTKKGQRRRCAGHKANGQPCGHWAMNESDYCRQHDPKLAAECAAECAAMWRRARPRLHSIGDVGRMG